MSKNLQRFVDNFVKGMQLGNQMQDRWEQQRYRRDSLEVAREKGRQSASQFDRRMANEDRRTEGYLQDVAGRVAKNMRPPAPRGGGRGGAAAMTPEQEAYYATYGAPPASTTPQATVVEVQQAEPPDTGTPQPPAMGFDPPEEGAARGGRMGRSRQAIRTRPDPANPGGTTGPGSGRGAIATAPPTTGFKRGGAVQRFAQGGEVMASDSEVNAQLPPPPDEPLWTPQGDIAREIAIETVRNRRMEAFERGLPVGQDTPSPTARRYGGQTFGGKTFGGKTFGASAKPAQPYGPGEEHNPGAPINQTVEQMPGWSRQDWQGEEDRADERPSQMPTLPPDTDAPMPNMPGPAAGRQGADGRNLPADRRPAGAPAGGRPPAGSAGARGRGAIDTGWKPLRDQTRTAAYDPQKDLYDPDNVYPTATALGGAVAYADRVFHQGNAPGQIQGQTSGEGAPTNPLKDKGRHALYGGVGAADPKLIEQIFQKIDPDGRMSMEQKMQASVKEVHKFYADQGMKEDADKSAFEVAQFANKVAGEYGKQALKQMQDGNMQGATETLIKGYNYLPDGHTAVAENGQIAIKDEQGNTVAQYPIDQRAVANIAMGMASGQLGWDVMRMGSSFQPQGAAPPGAPPPAQQVAAQPAAAPAGPRQTPAAPATAAPTSGAAPSSPPVAPPGAVSAPKPPAALTPAAPVSAAAPAASPPAGETTPPAQGDNVPGSALDTSQGPGRTKEVQYDPAKAEQEFRNKNPFGIPPGNTREQAPDPDFSADADVRKRIADRKAAQDERDKKNMIEGRKAGVKAADIRYNISRERKQMDEEIKAEEAKIKARHDNQERRDASERAASKPRDVPIGAEETFAGTISNRTKTLADEAQRKWRSAGPEKAEADQRANTHASSVLRWAVEDRDKEEVNRLATGLWRYNHNHNANNAVDDVVGLTSILRPKPDGTMPGGFNQQRGGKATVFKTLPSSTDKVVVLEVPTQGGKATRTIRMDRNTYAGIVDLHQRNWEQYEKEAAEAKRSKTVGEKAVQALKTLAPNLTSPLALPYYMKGASSGR